MSQENVKAVRQLAEAINLGGPPPSDLVAPTVEIVNATTAVTDGTYLGHEGADQWRRRPSLSHTQRHDVPGSHAGLRQSRRGPPSRAAGRIDVASSRAIVVRRGEGHRLGNVEFLARTVDTPRFTCGIVEMAPGRELEQHVHDDEDDAFYILEAS